MSRIFERELGLFCAGILGFSGLAGAAVEVPVLVERYCYECHGDGMDKGELAIDELLGLADGGGHGKWKEIWKMVRHEMMPPAGEEWPTAEEREEMERWMEATMLGVDHAEPDPGRVTIRRLNRMEYEYTVTDLFGVEIATEGVYSSDGGVAKHRLRDQLPPDDTAFGFDNIGAFQTLSPALLEKYFDIAEVVVGQVVSFDGPEYPVVELDAGAMEVVRPEGTERVEQGVGFVTEAAGEYRVEVQFTVGGWQEYGGAYDYSLGVDGDELAAERIEVGGQKTHEYSKVVVLEKGEHRIGLATEAKAPDSKGRMQRLELRPRVRVTGPMVEGTAVYPEVHRRLFYDGEAPAGEAERRGYAAEIVRRVADRAFRRPADERTVERLVGIVMGNEDFERGVGEALTAILVSPKFLFRAEMQPQPDDPEAVHPIDEWALASRLSYLLWLSLPDEELRGLAAAGELRANLGAQVERMLADGRSGRFFEDFAGQWLRTRNVLMTSITRGGDELGPVRGDMKRETEMMFEHLAREDVDLIELVTGDYSFLNEALAEYYGVDGVEGEAFRKVSFEPGSRRGGILTQGSFLVSTSNPSRTSPVKRGLFVLENLLSVEPPPPPPATPSLDEAKRDGEQPTTVREQLVLHREEKSCAACHAHFDPIGLVLENYNTIGKWRDDEDGEAIVTDETTISGDRLTGAGDLRAYFATRADRFYRCVTEKLMTYALGRGLEPADAVTVDGIAARLEAGGGRFSTLLMAVVESPAFQMRRGDDGVVAVPERESVAPSAPSIEERRRMQREWLERMNRRAKERAEAKRKREAGEAGE